MAKKAITDALLRKFKPTGEAGMVVDSVTPGLQMRWTAKGRISFRMRYSIDRKDYFINLGRYPGVSLIEARNKVDGIRKILDRGEDPKEVLAERESTDKKAKTTFKQIAYSWLKMKKKHTVPKYYDRLKARIDKNVLPQLGNKLAAKITTEEIIDCLSKMETQDKPALDQLQRVRGYIHSIYELAIEEDAIPLIKNPGKIRPERFKKHTKKHRRALSEDELPTFLQKLKAHEKKYFARQALWLALYTALRPGEVVQLHWDFIHEDKIVIPPEVMKMTDGRAPHHVPITPQIKAILDELRPHTEKRGWLFPNQRGKNAKQPYMHTDSLRRVIDDLGYRDRLDTHGARRMFSTTLNESRLFHSDAIERQLQHKEKNEIKAAYDHSQHWDERVKLMKWWSNYLEKATEPEDNLVFLKKK